MGWSYTRVTCAVFCSAVLRVSPRYNCAVFCITVMEKPELRMCFVLFCALCVIFCYTCAVCVLFFYTCAVCVLFCCMPCPSGSLGYTRVRALTQLPPVWSPAFSSLEMLYKCDLNLTLRQRNCVYHSNLFGFFYLQCVSYVSLTLAADVYTHFAGTSKHSTVLSLTLLC